MRDILIFTKERLELNICLNELKSKVKNIKKNGKDGIMTFGKNRVYLWINNEILDGSQYGDDELIKFVPKENIFINSLETYRSIDAKRFIEVLSILYEDIYLNIDDESNWFGTAEEFLNTNFNY